MHRNKNIEYDDDDLYPDEEEEYGEGQDGYTDEDRTNFATLTPVVRAELEEAGLQASNKEIEEALWHYYWDAGKSVAYLKNTRTPRAPQQQKSKKEKPKTKFDQAAQRSADNAGAAKSKSPTDDLAKRTQSLKVNSSPSTPSPPTIKSKGFDVPKLWKEGEATRKPAVAFVVIGHVDHGKSTLMGRLLLDTGAVSQRDIDKYKKQATELGKASFALAWVMDTGSEERERGVTVDMAQFLFSTEKADFTILDAPGHRDYVPNMIGGASMADLAVLVVDANQLDSGIRGQTKEHILLAKACGLKKIIVAVNKLDASTPKWDQDLFKHVEESVTQLLKECGFSANDATFVPCSGLTGVNVVKPASPDGPSSWVSKGYGPLLAELEKCVPPTITEADIKAPFRMQIADVFRAGMTNPSAAAGRITAGNVQIGDSVIIQPSGDSASVKGITVGGESREWAVAGEICSLHLTDNNEQQHLRPGDLVCSAREPVGTTQSFIARVRAVESLIPQDVDVHVGRLHSRAHIAALISIADEQGGVLRKKPRTVKPGQTAMIKLNVDDSLALESGSVVVTRTDGRTLATGRIERVGG